MGTSIGDYIGTTIASLSLGVPYFNTFSLKGTIMKKVYTSCLILKGAIMK